MNFDQLKSISTFLSAKGIKEHYIFITKEEFDFRFPFFYAHYSPVVSIETYEDDRIAKITAYEVDFIIINKSKI